MLLHHLLCNLTVGVIFLFFLFYYFLFLFYYFLFFCLLYYSLPLWAAVGKGLAVATAVVAFLSLDCAFCVHMSLVSTFRAKFLLFIGAFVINMIVGIAVHTLFDWGKPFMIDLPGCDGKVPFL